jgi:hypothetical protein
MADLTSIATAFPADQANTAAVIANTPFTNSYGTLTVTSNVLNVLCGLSFNNGAQTAEVYTWNGTGFYFKPTPAPKGGAATDMSTYCAIADGSSTDDSIRMSWIMNTAPATPTLVASHYNVDNTYSDPQGATSLTYSAVTHAWLGFYYDATNMYWVSSPDGTTWTTRRSSPREAWLASQADITFIYSTNRVAGSDTNALLDNVNTGGTAPGAPAGSKPTYPLVNYGLPGVNNQSAVRRASTW